jgi:orotidine-5'-phosphate decarboxylase
MNVNERLIVAADYDPAHLRSADACLIEFRKLVDSISGTGIIIKVNSLLRRFGFGLIEEINGAGLGCMADLKLDDIPNTMEIDAKFLREFKPDLLTVKCSAGIDGMARLKLALDDCEIIGVTVLTSFTPEDCSRVYGERDIEIMVLELFNLAKDAGIDGVVCSPNEVSGLSELQTDLKFIVPGIRPKWSIVENDDQNLNRVKTPREAILLGAHRIVVGRPITQSEDPKDAIEKTLEEISFALEESNA